MRNDIDTLYQDVTQKSAAVRPVLELRHAPSRLMALLMSGLIASVLMSLLAVAISVTRDVAADPAARAIVEARPVSAIMPALGAAIIMAALSWALAKLIRAATDAKSIVISNGFVAVAERTLFATRSWHQPIDAYQGLAHRVRSTLSGPRHEILLVHPDPRLTIRLAEEVKFSASEMARLHESLGLAEISSREAPKEARIAVRSPASAPEATASIARAA